MIDMNNARNAVTTFQELLDNTPPELAHVRVTSSAWTLTEIVGHLVDSAGNNHQRFARLRFGDLEGFPAYAAEPWVRVQEYDACDFAMLAGLWTNYNAFLLHLAETTPQEALGNVWKNGAEALSLKFLINDYYRHLEGHTGHYRDRLTEAVERRR